MSGIDGAEDFAPLLDTLDSLADRIEPGERKRLGGDIATDLRAAQVARIKPNVEPDGDEMVPRKQRGRARSQRMRAGTAGATSARKLRRERMFQRAAGTRYLRKESSQGQAQVGFAGAMARIMRVHQYGLADTVTRDPASPKIVYPARVVLGINPDDRARILDLVAARIAP